MTHKTFDLIETTEDLLDTLWDELGEDTFQVGGYIVQKIHIAQDETDWEFDIIRQDLNSFLMNVEDDFASSM